MSSAFPHTLPPFLREGMNRFDELYSAALESHSPSIRRTIEQQSRGVGKRVRPMLLMLVASAFTPLTDRILGGAVFVELLHVATLVHDDVVDSSPERRGVPSAHVLLGNQKAVLYGDFILASAVLQAVMTGEMGVVGRLATLGRSLSEGELLQSDIAELGIISEEEYMRVIDRKTASLIVASAEIGLILSGSSSHTTMEQVSQGAKLLGRAFQIKDDIFDYIPSADLGKPAGNDLREHKVTLPLIYALRSGAKESAKVAKILRHQQLSESEIAFLTHFAIREGGIDYAQQMVNDLVEQSKALFAQALPEGESLLCLQQLCDYVAERRK